MAVPTAGTDVEVAMIDVVTDAEPAAVVVAPRKSSIGVAAVGTRGDVEPLLCVALELAQRGPDVVFVTHRAHQALVESRLTVKSRVQAVWLCSLPAREWLGETDATPADVHRQEIVDALLCSDAICFNLFALEAYHVAEMLRVPCVVLSPCLIPYSMPERVAGRLARVHRDSALWKAIDQWMWPLLDKDRWAGWRRDALGLAEAVELMPVPILYGVSRRLVPKEGSWPENAEVCGWWRWPCAFAPATMPDEQAPILFCFGAMESVGLIEEPNVMIANIVAACEALGRTAILVTSSRALTDACEHLYGDPVSQSKHNKTQLVQSAEPWKAGFHELQSWDVWDKWRRRFPAARVLCVQQNVPFDWLIPCCVAVVHHGGSGTVAAAVCASRPQVVCYSMFDQHSWGERLEAVGVAPAPIRLTVLQESDVGYRALLSALQTAIGETMQRKALQLAAEHADAGGAAWAAELVMKHVIDVVAEPYDDDVHAMFTSDAYSSANGCEFRRVDDGSCLFSMTCPNGLELRCQAPSEADHLYQEIFIDDVYFRHGITIDRDSIVFDVGANVGMFCLKACWNADAAPTLIVTMEPMHESFQLLVQNTAHLRSRTRMVYVRKLAHAHERGTNLDSFYFPNMPGNSTLCLKDKVSDIQQAVGNARKARQLLRFQQRSCRATTVSAVAAKLGIPRIDLLKIDVEGSELDVLQGIDAHMWSLIKQVVIETTPNKLSLVMGQLTAHGLVVTVEVQPSPGTIMCYARLPTEKAV